jgi:hypothetical protein
MDPWTVRATDWTRYHSAPYKTAPWFRRFTVRRILRALRLHARDRASPEIVELGGANSCFFDEIARLLEPRLYHLVDNNDEGLARSRELALRDPRVRVHRDSVLDLSLRVEADLVLSVGLIEHFSRGDTRRAIDAHFDLARPGGLVLMTFPTPTELYWITRRISELLGLWIFHDERPLERGEVLAVTRGHGELLESEIVWPVILTQGLVAVRKGRLS